MECIQLCFITRYHLSEHPQPSTSSLFSPWDSNRCRIRESYPQPSFFLTLTFSFFPCWCVLMAEPTVCLPTSSYSLRAPAVLPLDLDQPSRQLSSSSCPWSLLASSQPPSHLLLQMHVQSQAWVGSLSPRGVHPAVSSLDGGAPHHPL